MLNYTTKIALHLVENTMHQVIYKIIHASPKFGKSGEILHPRTGGHRVVPRNDGPADLSTKVTKDDGPARRILDEEELEQLHRRIRQGLNKEDGQVIRICSDTALACPRSVFAGPRTETPGLARMGMPWGSSTDWDKYVGAARLLTVMSKYRRLVELIKPQSARVAPEFRAKARLVRNSPTDCRGPVWRVVLDGFVAELVNAGGVGRGKDERLFGED